MSILAQWTAVPYNVRISRKENTSTGESLYSVFLTTTWASWTDTMRHIVRTPRRRDAHTPRDETRFRASSAVIPQRRCWTYTGTSETISGGGMRLQCRRTELEQIHEAHVLCTNDIPPGDEAETFERATYKPRQGESVSSERVREAYKLTTVFPIWIVVQRRWLFFTHCKGAEGNSKANRGTFPEAREIVSSVQSSSSWRTSHSTAEMRVHIVETA